jgi:hypothetical protein
VAAASLFVDPEDDPPDEDPPDDEPPEDDVDEDVVFSSSLHAAVSAVLVSDTPARTTAE